MLLRQLAASSRGGARTGVFLPGSIARGSSCTPGYLRLRQSHSQPQPQPQKLRRPTPPTTSVSIPCLSVRCASTTTAPSRTSKRLRNLLITTLLLTSLTGTYILATDTRSSLHTYLVPPLLRLLFPTPSGAEAAHSFGIQALSRLYSMHLPLHDRSYGIPQDKIILNPDGTVDWVSLSQTGFLNPHDLSITLFGHMLTTPLGIPAGLDKHAEAVDALFAADPALGILEVGCVTPRPQAGNAGTRVWRLTGTEGMINRYGFNSVGSVEVARRLRERVRRFALRHGVSEEDVLNGLLPPTSSSSPTTGGQRPLPASLIPGRLLAIQLGKNLTTPADNLPAVISDYTTCVTTLGPYADLLVVNVSSPNTPGLRTLQSRAPLTSLLTAVVSTAESLPRRVKPKILVKVSPDEDTPEQIRDICSAVAESGVSGIIVANTTTRRDGLVGVGIGVTPEEARIIKEEAGGVSGPTLYPRMVDLVRKYRQELDAQRLWERFDSAESGGGESGQIESYWARSHRGDGVGVVVIGCGGVRRGDQVVEVMNKGAGGVWLYTGMVYGGVGTLGRVTGEMRRIIRLWGSKAGPGGGVDSGGLFGDEGKGEQGKGGRGKGE